MDIQRYFVIIFLLTILVACGGGGGGGATSGGITPTVVSGVTSKGIISGGTVTAFAINADGSKGSQLGQGTTKADGTYSISLGSYTGPVTLEVSGNYTDEATGQIKTVPVSAPLRSALGNASGTVTMAVTPLTDLAVRQAGVLTAQNITAANNLISETFKVDIIVTTPVAPTAAIFQSSQTTQAQKDYTLALAAVSQQMLLSRATLEATLAALNSGINSTGMNTQTAAIIKSDVTNFISNANNNTGVTTIADTSLQTVGSRTRKLTVLIAGTVDIVNGFQTIISFPAGVVLRADSTGKPLDGVIATTGSASSGMLVGKYTPATASTLATLSLGLVSTGGFAIGDVLTINADLLSGTADPAASAFTLSSSKLIDANGNTVGSASLIVK